jgi:peptidoglycan/LPS O-acetylase OafA/YrhL
MNYRREIDGLRALAVLPVILYHAGVQTFSGGFVGVDVFFVISGYLITTILLAELEKGKFSIINFYERRARRILPALFFVMFACLPFAWFWLLPGDLMDFSDSLVAVSTFISNILFWRTSGYFATATELKPLLHTWSLAVEEQYYVLFPIFLMLTWRIGKRRIIGLLVVLFLVSLAAAQWGSQARPEATFYLLPTRGWELLLGAFVAFYFSTGKRNLNEIASQLGSLLGLFLLAISIFLFDKHTPFPSLYTLVPTVGTALIILYATERTVVGTLLGNKLLVGIGLLSYSAYLWHQPVFAFARHYIDEPPKLLLIGLALASIALAFFSWKYVEAPFRSKERFGRKTIFVYSALFTTIFISLGVAGKLTSGFAYRYKESDRQLASLQKSEAGNYVQKRFSDLIMKPYAANDERKKVLIIGDSFAEDLVNALYEGSFDSHIQIATRHISHRCGNLFMDRTIFAGKIADYDLSLCANKGLFEDKKLRALMLASDEIWFASSWQYWQAELIQQSVASVESFTQKPVKVFGPKNFGEVNIKNLLSIDAEQRIALKAHVSAETIKTNALMKNSLEPNVFIDLQTLMCGSNENVCPLFTSSGDLISHDGSHLTEPGAKYCGAKLAHSVLLKSYLEDH